MDLKLDVLVCTTAKRLPSIDIGGWPQIAGVRYIISCQNPEELPIFFTCRPDIELHEFANRGLSVNRNQAFSLAKAPYVLIADDDTSFRADGLHKIIGTFDKNPALDYITFYSEQPEKRIYPPDGHDLAKPFPHYSPISFEIALRRESIERIGLQFSPLAGIGAPYLWAGEELFFLINARKKGLIGIFCNFTVAIHPAETTSVHSASKPGVIRAKGAVMRISRGSLTALTRFPIEAMRSEAPFFKAFKYLMQGYLYSIKHRKEL